MDRVNLQDRHDLLAEDINATNDLIIFSLKTAIQSFLKSPNTGYVVRGLDILAGSVGNTFTVNPGVAIAPSGDILILVAQSVNLSLADFTPGAINIVTLQFSEFGDDDPSVNPSPVVEDPGISPRPLRGLDRNAPPPSILPTRIYTQTTIVVETLAAYTALSAAELATRVNLKQLITPPLVSGNPGFVDPTLIVDPVFPQIIELNLPPNSIDTTSIKNFGLPLQTHQIEDHTNFIYGNKAENSLVCTIVVGPLTDTIAVSDVIVNRSFYVGGLRFITGALTVFNIAFSQVVDPSGIYTIFVLLHTDGSVTLEKSQGIADPINSLPIFTVQWDAVSGRMSNLVDIRNFFSVNIDNSIFQFIAPLLGLFGTGYFKGVAGELKVVPSAISPYSLEVSPGYGLTQDSTKAFGAMISYPTGTIIAMDPPDFFATSQTINSITNSGNNIDSIVYQLNANGFPPHAVQNVVITGLPGPVTLANGVNYVLDPVLGTVQFIFGGLVSAGSQVTINYEYGLPRIDLIVLDNAGIFSKVKGTAAQSPLKPNLPAGTIEWAILNVRDLASSYLSTDITNGAGYLALTRGFNYLNNRLGFPEIDSELGNGFGITGENLVSTSSLTINQRFQSIESVLNGVSVIPPPRMVYQMEVTPNSGPFDVTSFDPVIIAKVNRFSDQFRDVTGIVKIRLDFVYQDNITAFNSLVYHIQIYNLTNNQIIQEFFAPTNNALVFGTDCVSHFFSSFYIHNNSIRDVGFKVFINDGKKSKTNALNSAELSNYSAKVFNLVAEVWNFYIEDPL